MQFPNIEHFRDNKFYLCEIVLILEVSKAVACLAQHKKFGLQFLLFVSSLKKFCCIEKVLIFVVLLNKRHTAIEAISHLMSFLWYVCTIQLYIVTLHFTWPHVLLHSIALYSIAVKLCQNRDAAMCE